MRPRERRDSGEQDLFRARLDQIIDMNHALAKLARAIDWRFLETQFGAVYTDKPGRPPLPTRLMAGLAILKHTFNLSDEVVCDRWIENPYCANPTNASASSRSSCISAAPMPASPSAPIARCASSRPISAASSVTSRASSKASQLDKRRDFNEGAVLARKHDIATLAYNKHAGHGRHNSIQYQCPAIWRWSCGRKFLGLWRDWLTEIDETNKWNCLADHGVSLAPLRYLAVDRGI
jgi:hypothetical protein